MEELRTEMAVPHLVRSLASDDWQLRTRAAEALVTIASDRIEELLAAAASAPSGQRRWAISVLGRLRAAAAVEILVGSLESPDWMLREEAAVALARIGEPAAARVRDLAGHPDPAVRREVEWIQGQWAGSSGR